MEGQLIGEIERRPVLYDRSVQACKKMSARDEAWREVADIMKQSEAEVKKRWRTLRDSFMRYHRLQRTFGPKGKKKTWIYYAEMAFLIPHIEPRDYKQMSAAGGCFDGNEYVMDEAMDNNSGQHEPQFADMVSIASDMCKAELTTTTPPPPPLPPPPVPSQQQQQQHQHPPSLVIVSPGGCPCSYNGGGGGIHHAPSLLHHHREPSVTIMETGGGGGGGCKRRRSDESSDAGAAAAADSDEHFALSCVAALRRLPVRKNAEVRMRILHVLYEAEYGEEIAFG